MTGSCFTRLNGIWTGHRTLFAARCNHSPQIGLQTTTPIRASFGWSTFGRISWIRLSRRCNHPKQNRSRPSVSIIGIRYIYNRKRTGLTPTRQHSGRPVGSIPQVTGVTSSKFRNKRIRNRTDSGSNPTRTISGESAGCTPTKFVVDSEPSLVNQNRFRWHQHTAHRKWV